MNDRGDARRSIEPAAFEVVSGVEAHESSGAPRTFRVVAISAALAILLLGVFTVVFVLPGWVTPPEQPARAPVAGAAGAPVSAPSNEPPSAVTTVENTPAEEQPAKRKDTQQLLSESLEKLDALQGMKADSWAKSEMHAIRESIAEGEKAYREKRYNAAQNIYLDSQTRVERLLEQIPDFIEKLVDSGYLALQQGDSAGATNAFTQVLEIEPEHAKAARGLERAGTLDQVLALVGQAEGYERLEQIDQALGAYREALKLDADAPGAAAAVSRLERGLRKEAFRTAMSDGFKALEKNQFDTARTAFERAQKIDANAPEAGAALKQLANAEATFRISRAMQLAAAAESAERWDEAARQYEAALKVDSRLSAAIAGKRKAESRHRLHVRLDAYLAHPERFGNADVRNEADRILSEARAEADTGPRLQKQIAELERALIVARTPVTVAFRSNNTTRVTVYRVGELGSFDTREMPLLPGEYTAVGKRDGYRDVRVEFRIQPGDQGRLITIQCEEKFAFGS